MTTKPICVIYTGGTIGMEKNFDGIYQPTVGFQKLINHYIAPAILGKMPKYYLIETKTAIDSSDINSKHWINLAQIIDKQYDQCSGFIILHGTDTMAYTASMLSYIFPTLEKPIVLTGSQIPLCEPCSDAANNFLISLMMIEKGISPEVSICFGNQILRGNRATKISTSAMIAFESINYPKLAAFENQIKLFKTFWQSPKKLSKIPFELSQLNHYQVDIIYLTPSMPINSNLDILKKSIHGLILVSYGSGNIPSNNPRLLSLLNSAKDNNIVVLNISQCAGGEVNQQYASSIPLVKYNVASGGDITIEAAVAKLHFLLAKHNGNHKKVKAELSYSLAGEVNLS